MNETLVIQSFHAKPWPKTITRCIDSVQYWANQKKYHYKLIVDDIENNMSHVNFREVAASSAAGASGFISAPVSLLLVALSSFT